MTNTTSTTTRASWARAVTLAVAAAAIAAAAITLAAVGSGDAQAGATFPAGVYAKLPAAISVPGAHGTYQRCSIIRRRDGARDRCHVPGVGTVEVEQSLGHGLLLRPSRAGGHVIRPSRAAGPAIITDTLPQVTR